MENDCRRARFRGTKLPEVRSGAARRPRGRIGRLAHQRANRLPAFFDGVQVDSRKRRGARFVASGRRFPTPPPALRPPPRTPLPTTPPPPHALLPLPLSP